MLHPVCRRLPSSVSIWDDTNLPLSCVVTPLLASSEESSSSKQQEQQEPPLLSSIPKCLHCGAPHASTASHYPLHQTLLCHLCGKTCSTHIDDQASRRVEEVLEEDTYKGTSRNRRSTSTGREGEARVYEFSMPVWKKNQEIVSTAVPAMSCPPLWWIVVEGSPSRAYWNTISQALSAVVASLPPYMHVGLAMASSTHFSLWNVTSAVPLVQHYSSASASSSLLDTTTTDMVVANVGTYQSHIQAALRAMGDAMVMTEGSLPLSKVLQVLLDQVSDARHPGSTAADDDDALKPYAGGRVLVLLNGAPEELQQGAMDNSCSTLSLSENGQVGAGGRGGACFESGQRYATTLSHTAQTTPSLEEEDDDPESGRKQVRATKVSSKKRAAAKSTTRSSSSTDDDMTPANLERQYPKADKGLMRQFQELGEQFAEAAFGLDILVVQDQLQKNAHVGLPLLKPLYEPTGAPGPVVLDLTKPTVVKDLEDEVWSRRPVSFGGLLRLRMSPGFKVDTTPVERTAGPLQLAPLHSRKGLMGPAAAAEDDGLWYVGACDAHQAMTVDFQVTNKIKRFAFVNGMGEVALKPCMQVCFAYTTIVPTTTTTTTEGGGEEEEYMTVRRMRVCTMHMPMVNSVESLYASLDTEALSVVLHHKIAMAAFTEPLVDVHDIGRNWLKFIMTCAYRSAEEMHQRQQVKIQHGLPPQSDDTAMFYADERLVNNNKGGSSLSREDILLGQGHDTLRHIPLLVWGILQSDAIRPSSSTYRPTLDVRSAAMMQMTSMNPVTLARCIAPRLELWASGEDAKEPIVSAHDLGLSMQSVAEQLMELQQNDPNLILFLDAPYGIIVCDSRHLRSAAAAGRGGVVMGPALKASIQQAIDSYRTPPPTITYALDLATPVAHLWQDFLIEDAIIINEQQNFKEWKKDVAAAIYKDLEEGGGGDY